MLAEVAALGVASLRPGLVASLRPGLVASAVTLAKLLDNPEQWTAHASACGQLFKTLAALHKVSVPRRGRLASVSEMTRPSQ